MCVRRILVMVAALGGLALASCGNERTGTAFCRQLAREIPAIAEPIETKTQARAIVDRYERLLKVAPLTIEKDLRTLTDLLRLASRIDTQDTEDVQKLAEASYAAKQASLNVREWVKSTCAVDISTGSTIEPPRTVPPSTIPPSTTAAPATTGAPTTEAPPTTIDPTATTAAG